MTNGCAIKDSAHCARESSPVLHESSGHERCPGQLSQSAVYIAGGSQATSKPSSEPRSVSPGKRADLKYTPVSFEMGCKGFPQLSLLWECLQEN